MKTLSLVTIQRAEQAHLDHLKLYAEVMKDRQIINELPVLSSRVAANPDYGLIVIECQSGKDHDAWRCFTDGIFFLGQNKELFGMR